MQRMTWCDFMVKPSLIQMGHSLRISPTWRDAVGLLRCRWHRGHVWKRDGSWVRCERCGFLMLIVGEEHFTAHVHNKSFREFHVSYTRNVTKVAE